MEFKKINVLCELISNYHRSDQRSGCDQILLSRITRFTKVIFCGGWWLLPRNRKPFSDIYPTLRNSDTLL
ncbi:hypothetical protein Avbf_13886 [Armadillidium vulgare]|nr:hypothetical protein Avbf_13886 [Armadillidium vulgare]